MIVSNCTDGPNKNFSLDSQTRSLIFNSVFQCTSLVPIILIHVLHELTVRAVYWGKFGSQYCTLICTESMYLVMNQCPPLPFPLSLSLPPLQLGVGGGIFGGKTQLGGLGSLSAPSTGLGGGLGGGGLSGIGRPGVVAVIHFFSSRTVGPVFNCDNTISANCEYAF